MMEMREMVRWLVALVVTLLAMFGLEVGNQRAGGVVASNTPTGAWIGEWPTETPGPTVSGARRFAAMGATPTRIGAAQTVIACQGGALGAVTAINNINRRAGPEIADNVLGTLAKGTSYEAYAACGGWHLLAMGGWVSASVVRFRAATPTITATATPAAFDVTQDATRGAWVWVFIDVDGDGVLETVFRCADPCAMQVGNKGNEGK